MLCQRIRDRRHAAVAASWALHSCQHKQCVPSTFSRLLLSSFPPTPTSCGSLLPASAHPSVRVNEAQQRTGAAACHCPQQHQLSACLHLRVVLQQCLPGSCALLPFLPPIPRHIVAYVEMLVVMDYRRLMMPIFGAVPSFSFSLSRCNESKTLSCSQQCGNFRFCGSSHPDVPHDVDPDVLSLLL